MAGEEVSGHTGQDGVTRRFSGEIGLGIGAGKTT
jgi:hypothetical protein